MREVVIPMVIGVAVALAWFAMWTVALRAFGIPFFVRTPEERTARRERIVRMGKLRYTLIFGLLGMGAAFGLGTASADIVAPKSVDWVYEAIKFVLCTLVLGLLYGFKTWNESFRGEVAFPPHFPPQT